MREFCDPATFRMREFCDPATFRILMGTSPDAFVEATLEELLPYGFGPENLGR